MYAYRREEGTQVRQYDRNHRVRVGHKDAFLTGVILSAEVNPLAVSSVILQVVVDGEPITPRRRRVGIGRPHKGTVVIAEHCRGDQKHQYRSEQSAGEGRA